jgi:predicted small secreted protein
MRKLKSILVISLVLAFCISCATFEKNTYGTLKIAASTYTAAMNTVSGLQAAGKITADQRATINKYAKLYYDSYELAVKAFETYKKTQLASDQDKLVAAVSGAIANWANLAVLVNDISPKALPVKLQ